MRKLAYIAEIKELNPIHGADLILEATVLGWGCVVKKSENFKVGDKCIYFEIDTQVPVKPFYEFLEKRKYRIKSAKFKGCHSYGLILPLSALEYIMEDGYELKGDTIYSINQSFKIENDLDLSDILGVEKYDKTDTVEIGTGFKINPKKKWYINKMNYYIYLFKKTFRKLTKDRKEKFPNFIPKTDQLRIQSIPSTLENYRNKKFQVEMKADGSSMTVFYRKNNFRVASRNIIIRKDSDYYKVAIENNLNEKLKKYKHIALQMEMCGEGIQGNRYNFKGKTILVFDAYNIKEKRYLLPEEFNQLVKDLDLPHVPVIEYEFVLNHTVKELIDFVTKKAILNPKLWEEGYVFKCLETRKTFKVINPEYLKEKDE